MTLPNLPENTNKFILLIGITLIIFSFFEFKSLYREIDSIQGELNDRIREFDLASLEVERTTDLLLAKDEFISYKYDVESILDTLKDNRIVLKLTLYKSDERNLRKEIYPLWSDYRNKLIMFENKSTSMDYYQRNAENRIKMIRADLSLNWSLFYIGNFSFLVGMLIWINDEKLRRVEKRRKLFKKGLLYDYCQSCGKRFSPMRKFGNNKDKSTNFSFCEECFNNGTFTNNIKTIEEFNFKKDKALSKKTNPYAKSKLKYRLNNLERWKENEY